MVILQWTTIGPWTYALGKFGTVRSFSGLPPWLVRVKGRFVGDFETQQRARAALEQAARAAHYGVDR